MDSALQLPEKGLTLAATCVLASSLQSSSCRVVRSSKASLKCAIATPAVDGRRGCDSRLTSAITSMAATSNGTIRTRWDRRVLYMTAGSAYTKGKALQQTCPVRIQPARPSLCCSDDACVACDRFRSSHRHSRSHRCHGDGRQPLLRSPSDEPLRQPLVVCFCIACTALDRVGPHPLKTVTTRTMQQLSAMQASSCT